MYHFQSEGLFWGTKYVRKEEETIKFDEVERKIILKFHKNAIDKYLNEPILNKLYPKTRQLEVENPDDILDYFYNSDEFNLFFGIFRKVLSEIPIRYRGRYTILPMSRTFYIEFQERGGFSCYSKNFESVQINCGIKLLWLPDKLNYNSIKHEIYHFISKNWEEERVFLYRMSKWHKKLKRKISKNRETVNKLINMCENELNIERKFAEIVNIGYFFNDDLGLFTNLIADTALNIIALELGDSDYIKMTFLNDSIGNGNKECKSLASIVNKIKTKLPSGGGRDNFYFNLLVLLEFIAAVNYMPFNLFPYAIFDDYQQRNEILKKSVSFDFHTHAKIRFLEYSETVKNNFIPEANQAFLKFVASFHSIVQKMDIRSNLEYDDNRVIYNKECLRAAKEAYKQFNRLFNSLLKKVKDSEYSF